MKIYNTLIVDIESGRILHEDAFDYDGPVAMCSGGGSAPPPQLPTKEERELQKMQLQMLQDQRAWQKEFEPFMLESMGYERGEDGALRKIDRVLPEDLLMRKNLALSGYDEQGNRLTEEQMLEHMTDIERQQYMTQKATLQRQQDALEGKLEVSPALERAMSNEEQQAQEVLARKLGKDWAMSTSGQSLMKNIQEKNNLIREEARRGMITDLEGVNASKANISSGSQTNNLNLAGTFQNAANTNINRMMGYTQSQTAGWENMMDMTNKLAGERANLQNWQQANYQNQANQRSANIGMGVTAGVGVATIAVTAAV